MIDADADSQKPLLAVAGASGFVGTHLIQSLQAHFRFRALSRSAHIVGENQGKNQVEWQACDLYSLPKLSEALQGCHYAIYLVHSMAPSSRLLQASFEETDLLLADNFIRAAESAGVKHIVYLSGLMPQSAHGGLSPHLRSRLEVEKTLRAHSVPITVLRAGLIFGPGGSSFSMLVNLVRRLPVMVLPAWADNQTQSIDIKNICSAFRLCLLDKELRGGTYDLGGHVPMTYREMIQETARLLGRSPYTIQLPWNVFRFSKRWIAVLSGVPRALVGPLIESLKYDLVARPNSLLDRIRIELVSFENSLLQSVSAHGEALPNPRSQTQAADRIMIKKDRRVRSVQRMPLPIGWDAPRLASEYGNWLSHRHAGIVYATRDEDTGVVRFVFLFGKLVLLELTPTPYTLNDPNRCAFYISGGILSRRVDPPGRFEFRVFADHGCSIASIHGFAPTLPWWLYSITQAMVHLWVMRSFAKYLGRQS
jgi:uncharacterized protein YbjT (DUF2867 family)